MANLFVIGFQQPDGAEKLRLKLLQLQDKYFIDLQDIVVAVKDENSKVKLNYRGSPLTADAAVFPGFCGSLTALMFFNAATGAAGSALAAVGITQHFMKELAGTLLPGGSALFVLTGIPSPDKESVLGGLSGVGGKILKTSVSQVDEARLQSALRAAR